MNSRPDNVLQPKHHKRKRATEYTRHKKDPLTIEEESNPVKNSNYANKGQDDTQPVKTEQRNGLVHTI